jgi:hypothetical protein
MVAKGLAGILDVDTKVGFYSETNLSKNVWNNES